MRKVIWRLLLQREQFTPDEYSKVWLLASGAANTLNDNDKYYYLLRDQNTDYPNPCFCQIELDLKRTFPNEKPADIEKLIIPLKNVLDTFIKRNPTIGYCQGMNFIVGNILKYLNEEETFWVFTHIVENHLPLDYYSGMIGIMVDQRVFE